MTRISLLSIATLTSLSIVAASSALCEESPFDTQIDNIFSRTLENGLEVIVIEDHALPIVTIEIAVRNGAFTESPEFNGLSHLYEHMFFKGNAAIPDQESYLARQRELGMSCNGTTSEERVNYFFTLGSHRLCQGMVFMANAIRSPLFDQAELEREREVVLSEFDRYEANPYFHLNIASQQVLWGEHLSRKDALGDRHSIVNATRQQMVTIQHRYYVPNNSALLIAGNVEPEHAFDLAERLFGDWERAADPFIEHPPVTLEPLAQPIARLVEQPVQGITVLLAWHGPDVTRDPEATFAADVFSFIISQTAHRFVRHLVDSGLTLGADFSYYTQANVGPIYLTAQMQAPNLEAALAAIHEEIQEFSSPEYYSDEQMQTAKTLLAVSELYSRQQTTSWVHTVSFWWAVAGLDYYLNYVQNLQRVTRADIDHYLATYIQERPFVIVALANPEDIAALELTPDRLLEWFLSERVPTLTNPL